MKKKEITKILDENRGTRNIPFRILISLYDFYSKKKIEIFKDNKNTHLIERYNGIYFSIPKNAQTSFSKLFNKISKVRKVKKDSVICKNNFKFTIIRNPYDRLVSLYLNKIKNPNAKDFRKGIFCGFLKYNKFYENMPFNEFVRVIHSIPDKISDPHLKSQYLHISDNKGNILVDYIGYFESLEKNYLEICKRLNIINPPKLPHEEKSKREDYKNYYNEKTKKLVEERYCKDFELFGYKF